MSAMTELDKYVYRLIGPHVIFYPNSRASIMAPRCLQAEAATLLRRQGYRLSPRKGQSHD